MRTFTEEDLREAFRAGQAYGHWYINPSFAEPMNENEYIGSLNPKAIEEETITYDLISFDVV